MDKNNLITLIFSLLSSSLTWFATHMIHRREQKNDLESKLLKRIDDLTEKYLELNKMNIELADKFRELEYENRRLKRHIDKLLKAQEK
jgi:sensor histidine kinase YesM